MRKFLTELFCFFIHIYQLCVSPWFPRSCRYEPTCSNYGIEAIKKYGPGKGLWLTVRRVMRCHPWHSGGYDPVP
ncbi:MAG: membrane protein insertion efficiency factor YidD [Treponema sp.]|nr:membrane protein insertion efficiency factor YidD [Treponema sp.]